LDIPRRADRIALVVGELQQELPKAGRENPILRHFKLAMIKRIVKIRTYFEPMALGDVNLFESRKVPVVDAGSAERVHWDQRVSGILVEEGWIKEISTI
jgi:hypothetical protein